MQRPALLITDRSDDLCRRLLWRRMRYLGIAATKRSQPARHMDASALGLDEPRDDLPVRFPTEVANFYRCHTRPPAD